MAKTTLAKGGAFYQALSKNIGGWSRPGSGGRPCMSLREASEKFGVAHRTLIGWMHADNSPRPRSMSLSSRSTYYDAKELTLFIRAKKAEA